MGMNSVVEDAELRVEYKKGKKDMRQKILEMIEAKIDFWEKYVKFLLSKVEYEPESDGEIKIGEIENVEIRKGIIQTLTIVDDLDELKQKLQDGEE